MTGTFAEQLAAATTHALVGASIRELPSGRVGTVMEVDGARAHVQWPLASELPDGWGGGRWSWIRLDAEGTTWEVARG